MIELDSLEDLKEYFEDDEIDEGVTDKSIYRKYSKEMAITISYLLGVNDESALKRIENSNEYMAIVEKLAKDEDAVAIHHLNNIRSNLILNFKKISRALRDFSVDYKPLDKMEIFSYDFKMLSKLEIYISTGRTDINEYINNINSEIRKRIDKMGKYFPEWVSFKNIKSLFLMPKNIEEESKKFQQFNQYYPFQRYFYWAEPQECGYVLMTDSDILKIAYENNGQFFQEYSKVTDASDITKNNISDFINTSERIQIFIDGENADPYKVASTINGLADWAVDKTDKIVVYYDAVHTTKAWQYLAHFTCGIPVETVPVERISEEKSLVDHTLVVGISKAVYRDNADSIILISSDSDFWSAIKSIEDAKFIVLLERDKCGSCFKNVLRDHNVYYCYIDNFKEIENNLFFKTVFRSELDAEIKKNVMLCNAKELFNNALLQTRAEISVAEQENLFKKYIKGAKLIIDENDNFIISIPE